LVISFSTGQPHFPFYRNLRLCTAARLSDHNAQPEVPDKRIKIPVVVQ